MTTEVLTSERWQPFFDRISKSLTGRPVRVEITSLAIGHQVEADSMALLGLTYEPKNDVIELALEGLHHVIRCPLQVFVEHQGTQVLSIEIVDAAGERQIISPVESVLLSGNTENVAV